MYAVLVPIGPDARDVDRLHALAAELKRHEDPAEIRLVIVDDAPAARELGLDWSDQVTLRTPLWQERRAPDALSAHVAGTLEGLTLARGLEFAVKLDTDAAVIGSFSHRIRAAFADRHLGVVGSYDRTSTGATRDWSGWRRTIDRATLPMVINRGRGLTSPRYRSRKHRHAVREIRDVAFRFAPPGAHCLGGAYAVSDRFLQAAALDWRPWRGTHLGEDVVIGLLCSHAQLRMCSLTDIDEPFALAWRGLPGSPAELRAHGHSIVHSVKRDDPRDEQLLRAALQPQDPAGPERGSRVSR